jgi:hypothetical protein
MKGHKTMSEVQRLDQVEMLMKRVVIAESALKTIVGNAMVDRAMKRGKAELDAYLRKYPDSGMCWPY